MNSMYNVNRKGKIIAIFIGRGEWIAYHEGDEEIERRGWGEDKIAAIADLHRLDDEWADACEGEDEEAESCQHR